MSREQRLNRPRGLQTFYCGASCVTIELNDAGPSFVETVTRESDGSYKRESREYRDESEAKSAYFRASRMIARK